MIRSLRRQHIVAELATVETLLAALPDDDLLGRMSLESQRESLATDLRTLDDVAENRAKIALFFGGDPAVGSVGLEAGFGAESLGTFQDLVTKVWAADGGTLSAMGPIADKGASQLHITSLVHGSFGFLLEELDEAGEPLFESALRQASAHVAAYLSTTADDSDAKFTELLERLDQRVFKSIRDFFGTIHRAKATFRLVEGDNDTRFDQTAVERAWVRIEASNVDEEQVSLEGRLLGMIPVGRRFEFEADRAPKIIEGRVGEKFSQSYLERMQDEQFAGRRWKAVLNHKVIERRGRRPSETWTLIELDEIEPKTL